jgi:hypothetical protein
VVVDGQIELTTKTSVSSTILDDAITADLSDYTVFARRGADDLTTGLSCASPAP